MAAVSGQPGTLALRAAPSLPAGAAGRTVVSGEQRRAAQQRCGRQRGGIEQHGDRSGRRRATPARLPGRRRRRVRAPLKAGGGRQGAVRFQQRPPVRRRVEDGDIADAPGRPGACSGLRAKRRPAAAKRSSAAPARPPDRRRAPVRNSAAWLRAWARSSRMDRIAAAAKLPQISAMQSGTIRRILRKSGGAGASPRRPMSDQGARIAPSHAPKANQRFALRSMRISESLSTGLTRINASPSAFAPQRCYGHLCRQRAGTRGVRRGTTGIEVRQRSAKSCWRSRTGWARGLSAPRIASSSARISAWRAGS